MQQLNVLIAGKTPSGLVDKIIQSKYLNKLYSTYDIEVASAISIKFNTFKELAKKCKMLKVDLVIVEEEKWVLQGIGDVLRANFVNCIAPTSKWTKLGSSETMRRHLLEKYEIPLPKKIILPTEFPIIVRADGLFKKAESLTEVIKIKREIYNISTEIAQTIYLEELISGEKYRITSLYDGKNVLTFQNKIPSELIKVYSKMLQNMLNSEKAGFIGFINSDVTIYDNKVFNNGFNFKFVPPSSKIDLLYILISAMYQKLDEIKKQ